MLKASALYIVIVIALVIGVICSALIVSAYFYKAQNQRKVRYDNLANNLGSGINILLLSSDTSYNIEKKFSLFGGDADSISLKELPWGVYDIGIAKAFIQSDTLFKAFSIANIIDSAHWAALYLIDEGRPFSLSGKTILRGDAYIPEAGVQTAYVDNHAYQGDKRLIIGTRHKSEKQLPTLDAKRLALLDRLQHQAAGGDSILLTNDSIRVSFLKPTHFINFKKKPEVLDHKFYSGNLVMSSDTTLTIDSTCIFKNILVLAKSIIIKSGFHGNCQLFATDSISIGENCIFGYPSCLGIVLSKPVQSVKTQAKISIGRNSKFNGIIFTYEKVKSDLLPSISIGKKSKIKGQIYSQGQLELKDTCEIDGSIFTSRFIYRNSFTLFENYLINATIDSKALSSYYLTSGLLPASGKRKRVLQWLETN